MSNAKLKKSLKNEIIVLNERLLDLDGMLLCPVMGDYYWGEYQGVQQLMNSKQAELDAL